MTSTPLFSITFSDDIYLLPEPITIVVEKPWVNVSTEERVQLSKILNALKFSLEKVRVAFQADLDLTKLIGHPSYVIVFGLTLKGVNLYEPITIKDTRLVMSESLSALLTNDDAKKKLWLALKPMFGL
jgi:DNA polymerase III psi subunit